MIGGPGTLAGLDPALPLLATMDRRDQAELLLSQILGGPVPLAGLHMVKHRPGRRCILRAELAPESLPERPMAGGAGPAAGPEPAAAPALFLKLYASGRAPTVARRTAACGDLRACGPQVDLPPVLAAWESGGLVVIGGLGGLPFAQALARGQRGLARRLAQGLSHLHALEAQDLPLEHRSAFALHDAARELAPLARRLAALAEARPALAPAAEQAERRVTRALGATEAIPWRRRLLHRDLHPEQVLVQGERLAILDWDDAALGEPAVDLANFAAHLRLAAFCAPEAALAARFAQAAGDLVTWARRLDPQLSAPLLRLLEAATLLRLATLHLDRSLSEPQAAALLRRADRAFGAAWTRLTDGDPGR